jgi:hypothetical protein
LLRLHLVADNPPVPGQIGVHLRSLTDIRKIGLSRKPFDFGTY